MKKFQILLNLLFSCIITAAVSGCYSEGTGEITSALPNPSEEINLELSQMQLFKVTGQASTVHRYAWYAQGIGQDESPIYVGDGTTFLFKSVPEAGYNKTIITCDLSLILIKWQCLDPIHGYGCGYLPTIEKKDTREWLIHVSQEPPTWEGNYSIQDLADIQELADFTEITGNLNIYGSMTSLTGLENITSVGGDLQIGAQSLTTLAGLDNLTSVGGVISISDAFFLTSLTALGNIRMAGGIGIENNDSLITLAGLDGLTSIDGSIAILWNDSLTSLIPLENLTQITGNLMIFSNASLTDMGLSNLYTVGGDFYIANNSELCEYKAEALRDQVTISGDVEIYDNKDCSMP